MMTKEFELIILKTCGAETGSRCYEVGILNGVKHSLVLDRAFQKIKLEHKRIHKKNAGGLNQVNLTCG